VNDTSLGYALIILLGALTLLIVFSLVMAIRHRHDTTRPAWTVWYAVCAPVGIGLLSVMLFGLPLESNLIILGMCTVMSAVAYWLFRPGGIG